MYIIARMDQRKNDAPHGADTRAHSRVRSGDRNRGSGDTPVSAFNVVSAIRRPDVMLFKHEYLLSYSEREKPKSETSNAIRMVVKAGQ